MTLAWLIFLDPMPLLAVDFIILGHKHMQTGVWERVEVQD